jgi:hypothetical protein
MDDLSISQPGLLQDLQDLGIIYRKHKCASPAISLCLSGIDPVETSCDLSDSSGRMRCRTSRWLYPTQLAVSLSSTEAAKRDQEGWIIVGTDYRIYAYTSSPVPIPSVQA